MINQINLPPEGKIVALEFEDLKHIWLLSGALATNWEVYIDRVKRRPAFFFYWDGAS